MQAPVTFAIAGFGDRGSTYASMEQLFPDKMKVVAVADLDPAKVEKARKLYNIPQENCFSSAEEMLEKDKLGRCDGGIHHGPAACGPRYPRFAEGV